MSLPEACRLVDGAQRIVALTGAGISTPSGIPDFRSPQTGLWEQNDPMVVACRTTFERTPERFYNWFRPLLELIVRAQPNPAHVALAQLEQAGRLTAVVTQNIDGLHQAAGSHVVYELHGNLRSATCLNCERTVPAQPLLPQAIAGTVPRCSCGGLLKPAIVLFGDELPLGLFWLAEKAIDECDLLIVAGSSLEVEPVCLLPRKALRRAGRDRARILVVNYTPTWLDEYADIVLTADVAEILPQLAQAVSPSGKD